MTQSILLSFFYWNRVDLDAMFAGTAKRSVFADSGAFSASTLGGEVTIASYADWLKRWERHFELYANLDVIGDWKATGDNQKRLEDLGLKPTPVFHWGSPFAELDRLCDLYPYIALGGIVKVPKRTSIPWLNECFRVRGKRSVKFHGFGVTGLDVMQAFDWASVDSSSWVAPQKFGVVSLFDGQKVRRAKYGANASASDRAFLRKGSTQSLLARNGVTSDLVLGRATPRDAAYQGMVAAHRMELALAARRPGFRMFLALANKNPQFDLVLEMEKANP